jgi:F0F1-type ATP synthase assembly protein I
MLIWIGLACSAAGIIINLVVPSAPWAALHGIIFGMNAVVLILDRSLKGER